MVPVKVDIHPSDQTVSLPQLCGLLDIAMPAINLSSQQAKNESINMFIKELRWKLKDRNTVKINKSNERPLINKELLFDYRLELNYEPVGSFLTRIDKNVILNILLEREAIDLEGLKLAELARQIRVIFRKFRKFPQHKDLVDNFLNELSDRKILRTNGKRIGIRIPDVNFDILSEENYIAKTLFIKYEKVLKQTKTFDSAVKYLINSEKRFMYMDPIQAAHRAGSLIAHYVASGKLD